MLVKYIMTPIIAYYGVQSDARVAINVLSHHCDNFMCIGNTDFRKLYSLDTINVKVNLIVYHCVDN